MPRGRPRGATTGKIKGAMTAYACFVKTCREEHQKLHPEEDVKFGEFSAQCSQRWKTMTDKEKERFHEMALEDKERFEYQMRDFLPHMGMGRRRRRRQRREKDPNKPKRALSAFFYFAKDARPGIREVNPEWTVGECAKELGRRWSEMTEEAKAPYDKLSEDDKARYDTEMKVYRLSEYRGLPQQMSSNGHGHSAHVEESYHHDDQDDDEYDDDEGHSSGALQGAHGLLQQHMLAQQHLGVVDPQMAQHHQMAEGGHPQMTMPQMPM